MRKNYKKTIYHLGFFRDSNGKLREKVFIVYTPLEETNEKENRNNKRGYFERNIEVS